GEVELAVNVFSDLTERKNAEDAWRFLAEAGATLASSLDYRTTLGTVARLAVPGLADLCAVDVVDERGTIRRVARAHVDPEKDRLAQEVRDRYGFNPDAPRGVPAVVRTGRPAFMPEVTDADLAAAAGHPEQLAMFRALGLKSWIIVPLVARGRVLGALTFAITESARRYDGADLLLAQDLAARAAFAVDNARLFAETGARRREAEALTQVSRALNETLDPDAAARRIAESVRALLGAQLAIVYRAVPESSALCILAVAGDPGRNFPAGFELPRGAGAAGRAVRERRPVSSPDVLADERLFTPPELRTRLERVPHRSSLAVPLIVKGDVIGTLLVGDVAGRVYGEHEIELARAFADQAALVLENARLFAEAERGRQDAETANRAKDEFLATLSHEVRTPLNAMFGWARMLRTGTLDAAAARRGVAAVERNIQLLVQLIEDLLDVSRIVTGKLRLEVRSIDLGAVVEAAVETVRSAADARAIRLETSIDRRAAAALGDPDRLQQVVWNLLSNAIKFTPRDGRVEVVLTRVESHAELTVRDTGQGIRREFLPFLFDRFRQADASTTRQHRGMGLGLSIVKSLVEMHGGTIAA
ncbi:MAG TPA: GAF domain-containing protein, partial [Methylomirabilota bacterium]|nr:GAF domain-containing protein [Methylomirabilota bacterium]